MVIIKHTHTIDHLSQQPLPASALPALLTPRSLCHETRLHGAAVARCITANTVLVVASAPGFPHGVVDDVTGTAAAAAKRGVLCHVDGCLGGFLLPFVERLGHEVPTFDFRVPGEH